MSDGQYSQVRNVDVIDMARANHEAMLCLPPDSTHRMRPLDLEVLSPLETYFAQELETWLKNNLDRVVTKSIVCNRAASVEVSVNSFRKTGLFALNRNIFRRYEYEEIVSEETKSTQQSIESGSPKQSESPVASRSTFCTPSEIIPIPRQQQSTSLRLSSASLIVA